MQPYLKKPGDESRLGEAARGAAGRASAVLDRDENVSVSMIVGHVQATAVDTLRSLGVDRVEAHEKIGAVVRAAQFEPEWDEEAERIARGESEGRAERSE
jgi:hypothetical protein